MGFLLFLPLLAKGNITGIWFMLVGCPIREFQVEGVIFRFQLESAYRIRVLSTNGKKVHTCQGQKKITGKEAP